MKFKLQNVRTREWTRTHQFQIALKVAWFWTGVTTFREQTIWVDATVDTRHTSNNQTRCKNRQNKRLRRVSDHNGPLPSRNVNEQVCPLPQVYSCRVYSFVLSLMLEPSVQQALYLQNSYLDGHGRLKVPSGPEHEQPNDSAKIDGSKSVAPQPNVTSTTASSGDAATKAAMTSDPGQHKQRWDFFHRSKYLSASWHA